MYWSFTEPPLKQPLKHDRMKVIDQGKEMVLRVDDDAAHSTKDPRRKVMVTGREGERDEDSHTGRD